MLAAPRIDTYPSGASDTSKQSDRSPRRSPSREIQPTIVPPFYRAALELGATNGIGGLGTAARTG